MANVKNDRTKLPILSKDLQSVLVAVLVAMGFLLFAAIPMTAMDDKQGVVATTIVTWGLVVVTSLLVFIVYVQVNAARESTRESLAHSDRQRQLWATLQVCDRYDIDSEIAESVRHLRKYHWYRGPCLSPPGVGGPKVNSAVRRAELLPTDVGEHLTVDQKYTMAAGKLLNYFDSIAIGLQQNFYVEEVAQEHVGSIFVSWMIDLRSSNPKHFDNLMQKSFGRLPKLFRDWGGCWPEPDTFSADATSNIEDQKVDAD